MTLETEWKLKEAAKKAATAIKANPAREGDLRGMYYQKIKSFALYGDAKRILRQFLN